MHTILLVWSIMALFRPLCGCMTGTGIYRVLATAMSIP